MLEDLLIISSQKAFWRRHHRASILSFIAVAWSLLEEYSRVVGASTKTAYVLVSVAILSSTVIVVEHWAKTDGGAYQFSLRSLLIVVGLTGVFLFLWTESLLDRVFPNLSVPIVFGLGCLIVIAFRAAGQAVFFIAAFVSHRCPTRTMGQSSVGRTITHPGEEKGNGGRGTGPIDSRR